MKIVVITGQMIITAAIVATIPAPVGIPLAFLIQNTRMSRAYNKQQQGNRK
jgi:hypothetical protein